MHCRSCEVLIEDALSGVPGVEHASAKTAKGSVEITGNDFSDKEISAAISGAGYSVGNEALPFFSFSRQSLKEIAIGFFLFLIFWAFIKFFNLDKVFLVAGQNEVGFVGGLSVGLLAGLSTCMALVGGLVLGISTRYVEKHPGETTLQKFKPHLFFNGGRIISFAILGGLLGSLGSVLGLQGNLLGLLTIFVGFLMLYLGIQALEIFPRLNNINLLPKGIGALLYSKKSMIDGYSHKKAFLFGVLTFFIPCGFTQAMQISAAASGSFWVGASTLGGFAIGTSVGLLGIGGLTASIKNHSYGKVILKAMAVLIIFLALYNLKIGYNLTGFEFIPRAKQEVADTSSYSTGERSGELVVFSAAYDPHEVSETIKPHKFVAKKNDIVRIEILAREDGVGCMGSVMIPGIVNIPEYFKKDEIVTLEFRAEKTGKFQLTCAMGVPSGEIVIKD